MNFNTYDEIVSFSTEDQDLPFGRGHPSAYHQIQMRSMTTMMITLILNHYRRLRLRRQTHSVMTLSQKYHHLNRKVIPQLQCIGHLSYLTQCRYLPPRKPQRAAQTAEDRFRMEDTMASIRLRVRHTDAYEEWEHQTRRDAFVSFYIARRIDS